MFSNKRVEALEKKVLELSSALFALKHKLFNERNPLRFKVGDKVIVTAEYNFSPNLSKKGIVTKAYTRWPDDFTGEFVNLYDVTADDGGQWTNAQDHNLKLANEQPTKNRKHSRV